MRGVAVNTNTDDGISQGYPGVPRETLERLNEALGRLGAFARERSVLQSEASAAARAATAPFEERMDQLDAGFESAMSDVVRLYTEEVLARANHESDVITMKLRAGTLELRFGSEALVYDHEDQLEDWARRNGVLGQSAERVWRFSKSKLKALLRERPKLRRSIERTGVAHIERSRTLTVKPQQAQVELSEKIASLKAQL